ncbi:ferric siderophore receptor [Oxalicibacterium faecigallinarum]|uniref:Ferric siderophore receptor n=2 Tax=Oxalicibacterium faecigallinarum TaxID=573741 RepID=A0A8J3ARI9_9BURK|nr:ferric siderophore receptor [Oxalicibacterium faecigallinarum]
MTQPHHQQAASTALIASPQSFKRTAIAGAVLHLVLGVAVLVPSVAPTQAHAQTAEVTRTYNIPAGQLTGALNRFGREAGIMLSFSTEMTDSLQTRGLQGTHGVDSALTMLLTGTGLQAARQKNGGYLLQHQPTAMPSDTTLPTVRVTGVQESATGPVLGYVASRTSTATKTDTPLIEVPQSISVVGRQQMEDQKAQTIQDALGYTAGLMTGISAKNPLIDDTVSIRGFAADPQNGSYYRDGMRYMANLYNGKQEVYGLERIEVLKGPSSILYGAAAPGGVINTVTKRPTSPPLREINVEYGSHNRRQLSADFGGPLDDQGIWSYRITALERKSGTYIDYGRDDRTYIAPALTWQPSAATSLTLLASYQKSNTIFAPSVPVTGSLLPNPNGQIPRNRFLGDTSHNKFETNTSTIGYLFEHAFSDTLKLRHSLRYYESDLDMRYTVLTGDVNGTGRQVSLSPRGFLDDTSIFTMDTNMEKTWHVGNVKHVVLAGFDYTNSRYDSTRTRGAANRLFDIYNSVYLTGPVPMNFDRTVIAKEKKLGFYLQDQIKVSDKWVVLLGGRYDKADVFSDQIRSTTRVSDDGSDSAFTGRAGLVYLAANGFAPYISFTQSFEPTAQTDRFGARFKPSEGEQTEIGLRYQPPGTDTLLTASLYDLKRTNVTTRDPVESTFQVQTGEVRSRGLELELKTKLGKSVDVIGAYTYTDAEVTKSNNPGEQGERFNSPRNLLSLWMNAKLGMFDLPNWSAGAGVRYVSSRPNRPSLPARGGPAYTLMDARIGYVDGPWSYALNITNLTDRTYIPSMCYSGICDYGMPRQVTGTMTYRW